MYMCDVTNNPLVNKPVPSPQKSKGKSSKFFVTEIFKILNRERPLELVLALCILYLLLYHQCILYVVTCKIAILGNMRSSGSLLTFCLNFEWLIILFCLVITYWLVCYFLCCTSRSYWWRHWRRRRRCKSLGRFITWLQLRLEENWRWSFVSFMIVLSHLIKHKSSTWILLNFSAFSRITVMDILALGEFSAAPCSTCLSSARKSGVFTCFHLSWKKTE